MEIVSEFSCDECGFDNTKLDNAALVEMLAANAPQWSAPLSDVRPSSDVWSPREYAWHYAAVIDWYGDRIDVVLTEERPQLVGHDYTADPEPVDGVATHITRSTERVVARLRGLTPEQWERIGIGSSDGGERDVRNLASRLAHEGFHHLLDIGKHQ